MTTRSEMEVALRSSRTRTTVPSRISRTIGSSASEREFQASQSPFTLRQTRLTVSLPTSPPNTLRTCAAHAARIGAGQIHPGDQRVGSQRAALIFPQRLALHFRRQDDGMEEPCAAISVFPYVPVSVRTRLPCRMTVPTAATHLPSAFSTRLLYSG